jgi:hypothetical protein
MSKNKSPEQKAAEQAARDKFMADSLAAIQAKADALPRLANARGRPRKIQSPDHFDDLVDAYVNFCYEVEEPLTITGLALFVGFCNKRELHKFKTDQPNFASSINRAVSVVEAGYERNLHAASAGGSIFALKNFGWHDKTEHEVTGAAGGPVLIRRVMVDPTGGSSSE